MTTLLVMTAGQSDVQLVVDGVRRELHKERSAALHDELERRADSWRLIDSPPGKVDVPVDALPEGELLLCTPKLDAVLRETAPTSALVLATRRDAKAAPGDPRFAGALLEERLKNKGVAPVLRQAYLEGTERLEDRDRPRDAVIRHEVVQRIERAVRETLETSKPSRIVVATTGGFPVVSNLVEEIVRLHAPVGVPVELLEVADGAKADPPTNDRAVRRNWTPEPSASYQARRHALELIEKGNLLGAWGAVQHLNKDEIEREWTQVVEWLARFACSLPMPESCDIPVLKHHRMAVRAALRVELALRSGDIPRAVHGTVAFFECALWDHLGELVERHPDETKRRYYKIKSGEAPAEKLRRKGDGSDEDRKRPFIPKEPVNRTQWYWIDDSEVCAIQLAKHYLKRDGLTKLGQAVSAIRELRNDVAHSEPTPALMHGARQRLAEAKLWSNQDTFLAQPLVQDALRELGVQQAESICDVMISTVRNRVLCPSGYFGDGP
ncbi:MAG: hypothetical protein M5U22_16665 [Thermoleophilia bacterium]|nr:hypothetical protein [Thermoleophilia bacterium]